MRQIAEFFILGRNYINVVAPEDESIREIFLEQKYLFFFTWSRIVTDRGTHLVYAPEATLGHDFQVVPGARYKRGQIIARGAIDTGDQVFVDKFIYNFMKPHRGDVFVFRTKHIPMIPEVPDDRAPLLYQASGRFGGRTLFGSTRRYCISTVNRPGVRLSTSDAGQVSLSRLYSGPPISGQGPDQSFTVSPHSYFAMGDNSYFSYDSRYWGPVPEENLVGRGLWVYWPFNQHWGLVADANRSNGVMA